MTKYEKCPKCGERTINYNPVKQEAYCRRSVCSFREHVGDEVAYDEKFS